VDECFRAFSDCRGVVVLFYFYQNEDRTAKAFFASLLKQLLAVLIDKAMPCPESVRNEIEHAFGRENSQPTVGELVDDILAPLMSSFKDILILLDGSDACEEHEQRELWEYLRRITRARSHGFTARVAVSTQDPTKVTSHLPNTVRLRLDCDLTRIDIDAFIDQQVDSHSSKGQLLCDHSLRKLVRRTLKEKTNGM